MVTVTVWWWWCSGEDWPLKVSDHVLMDNDGVC